MWRTHENRSLVEKQIQFVTAFDLSNQSSNFIGLFSLDPGDPLLHQISTFHVQKQSSIISLNFASRDDLGKWIMEESFMGDQIKKTDSVLVEC